ncbi:MAG TPA: ATP-binding protein [Candidatus Acidoferrum sp.]|nr:ATP-binding protein [Candidatus Acidoferrum sp.]
MPDQVSGAEGLPTGMRVVGGDDGPRFFPQFLLAATVVVGISLPALLLNPLVGHRAIALLYLLTVVFLALFVERGPTLFAAALSAVLWDLLFLEPIGNLSIRNAEDAIMFGMYFVVALVLGQLTARIRAQERSEHQREAHATALYRLTRELLEATGRQHLVTQAVREMESAFSARIVILLPDSSGRLSLHAENGSSYELAGPEQSLALRVFEQGQPAGDSPRAFPPAETLFVPLLAGGDTLGVLGLHFEAATSGLSAQQRQLLSAFAQQIALALDRQRLREQSEQARLLAESERLSRALLNSVSHEIRTPLAAIKGALDNLQELTEPPLSAEQRSMLAEVGQATDRLNRLIGKVLDITRLESGTVRPAPTLCDITDLVHVVVKEARPELANHRLEVALAPNLPLVHMDFVLTQEALKNLLSNAALHTPPGTPVEIGGRIRDGRLLLTVADRGPGIPPESLSRLFDKFYRAPGARTGGTGLGLSVAKGFVEAQGGWVVAENRPGGGALFTIILPLGQAVPLAAGSAARTEPASQPLAAAQAQARCE